LVGEFARLQLDNGMPAMVAWRLADAPPRPSYAVLAGRALAVTQVDPGGAVLDEVAGGAEWTGLARGAPRPPARGDGLSDASVPWNFAVGDDVCQGTILR
jgi:hypothetical protein